MIRDSVISWLFLFRNQNAGTLLKLMQQITHPGNRVKVTITSRPHVVDIGGVIDRCDLFIMCMSTSNLIHPKAEESSGAIIINNHMELNI